MKQSLKYALQIIFYVVFCYFSYGSLKHFYEGSVIYETIHDFDNTDVPFPSLTLCPALKSNNLVNLKLNNIAADFNLQANDMQSYKIYNALKGLDASFMDIVRNYSFTYMDGFYIDHVVTIMYGKESKFRNDSNSLV